MNKIEINTGLNKRQWALYRYLKDKGDEWTTQFAIVDDLREFYNYIVDDLSNFHDSSARSTLTKDIRAINASDYIHKPILSSPRGIKIANSEEIDRYIGANINSAVNRLKRLKKLSEKANKNGQYRLMLSEHQRKIYESFIDDVSQSREI